MSLSKLGFLSMVLVAAGAANSTAYAENNLRAPKVAQVTVKYGDLNVRSAEGATTLVKRVARAARQACGFPSLIGPGSFEIQKRRQACIREAEAAAIATVDHPVVTAVYGEVRGSIAATVATR